MSEVEHADRALRSRTRYARAGWGYATTILARSISFAVAIATIPLTLPYLGPERFGMWMTINSFVALLSFANLGIGQSLMTSIAHQDGRGDAEGQRATISNALAICLVLSLGLAVLVLLVGPVVPWWRVLNVSSPVAVAEAGPSMAVFAAGFLLALPAGLASNVWMGLQRTHVAGLFLALGPLLGLVGIVACVVTGQGVPLLVAAVTGGPLIAAVLGAGLLLVRWPGLRPSLRLVSVPAARSLLGLGLGFFLLQIAIAVATGSDALILAQVVGPTAVTEYAVVARLFNVPLQLGTAIVAALWPSLAEARSRGDHEWVGTAIRRVVMASSAITVPLAAALVIGGPVIVNLVTQGRVEPDLGLYLAFAAATLAMVLASVVSVFLNSAAVVWPQVICLGTMAAANVVLGIWLSTELGSSGVVWSTAITYGVMLIPLGYLGRRLLLEHSGR